MSDEPVEAEYVVVLRTRSAARYLPEGGFEFNLEATPALGIRAARTRAFTRWVAAGDDELPRELTVEVRGAADSLDEAIERFYMLAQPIALLVVGGAPPPGTVNQPFAYQFTVSGFPPPQVAVVGTLPAGLRLTPSGLLTGTPTQAGSSSLALAAFNMAGNASTPFDLVIMSPPTITGDTNPLGVAGQDFGEFYHATGAPIPTMAVDGTMPPGLSFNPASGLLSGVPTTGGTYVFALPRPTGSPRPVASR